MMQQPAVEEKRSPVAPTAMMQELAVEELRSAAVTATAVWSNNLLWWRLPWSAVCCFVRDCGVLAVFSDQSSSFFESACA